MRQGLILAVLALLAGPARAQEAMPDMPGMDHMQMDHGDMSEMDHAHMEHDHMVMGPVVGMAGVSGSFGFHPYEREAIFGTAWQPDSTPKSGVRAAAGDWLLIGTADVQASGGKRGLWSGAVTASARYDFDNTDALQARIRLTPGAVTPVLGELAASYAHRLGISDTLFVYAGIYGQPAFGPPDAQDRLSRGGDPLGLADQEIGSSAGVVTGGWSHDEWKLDASAFNGAAARLDRLGSPRLDAWSARLSLAPAHDWSLQVSYAGLRQEDRASVSAIYTRTFGEKGWWSATAAVGWRSRTHTTPMLEAAVSPDGLLMLYGRAERGRQALGAERNLPIASHIALGIGGEYASDGSLGFVRLRWR